MRVATVTIYARLQANCRNDPITAEWLVRLPRVIDEISERWSLVLDAPFE